jgi:hypothetical protein
VTGQSQLVVSRIEILLIKISNYLKFGWNSKDTVLGGRYFYNVPEGQGLKGRLMSMRRQICSGFAETNFLIYGPSAGGPVVHLDVRSTAQISYRKLIWNCPTFS